MTNSATNYPTPKMDSWRNITDNNTDSIGVSKAIFEQIPVVVRRKALFQSRKAIAPGKIAK